MRKLTKINRGATLNQLRRAGVDDKTIIIVIDDKFNQQEDACKLCNGLGELSTPIWNDDAHCYELSSTEKCLCMQKPRNYTHFEGLD